MGARESVILAALLEVLETAGGRVLDAVSRGDLDGDEVRAAFAAAPQLADSSPPELHDAIGSWFALEAEGWTYAAVAVFAAAADYPIAEVVSIRANRSIHDARIVTVLCPFAHLHAERSERARYHDHGWPGGRPIADGGSLGLRHPHCGELVGDVDHLSLSQYELVLPPHLIESTS